MLHTWVDVLFVLSHAVTRLDAAEGFFNMNEFSLARRCFWQADGMLMIVRREPSLSDAERIELDKIERRARTLEPLLKEA